jgi:hypothetical protein
MKKTREARIKIIGRVSPMRVRIYLRRPIEPLMKTYRSMSTKGTPIISKIKAIGVMIYDDCILRAGYSRPQKSMLWCFD